MSAPAGPLPRWLWDSTPQRWILLRADGTLTYDAGPADPPAPKDPLVRLKLDGGWREYHADGSSSPLDSRDFLGGIVCVASEQKK